MRIVYIIRYVTGALLLYAMSATAGNTSATEVPRVRQELRYTCEGAREVFLVWKINGAQPADSAARPAGTVIRDGWLYTPMQREAEIFSTVLPLKKNTLINYKFWITKGLRDQPTDLWDAGPPGDTLSAREGRQALGLQDNIVLVESSLSARPSGQPSILDFSGRILAVVMMLLILTWMMKRIFFRQKTINPGPYTIVVAGALGLLPVLLLARASVVQLGWDFYLHPLDTVPIVSRSGFYDVIYIVSLSLIFMMLLFLFRKQSATQYALSYSFVGIVLVSAVAGLFNIRMTELDYTPYDFRRFYYNSFLDETFSKKELVSSFTSGYLADLVMMGIATLGIVLLMIFPVTLFIQNRRTPKFIFAILCCAGLIYLFTGKKELQAQNGGCDRLANPVAGFIFSVNPFSEHPQLFTMPVPDSLRKFPQQAESTLAASYADLPGKIKNVIVVMMGSVGSAFTAPQDSLYKATPRLAGCLEHAIVFRNMYSQEPFAESALVPLLGSVQPWLSAASLAAAHPDIDQPSLSAELKKKGYRTGCFNSGDNKSEGIETFLLHRGFEVVKDKKRIGCRQGGTNQKNSDLCTEKELISWLRIAPANPFFAVIITKQTEQPCFFWGEPKSFRTKDALLTRYLNALTETDAMIGKLIDDLKHNKLYESTLLVVIGDKGGAFSTLSYVQPAGSLREEQVHVPCIFINPFLKPESIQAPGALCDLAPTVMQVLGYESPRVWQGSSLLAGAPSRDLFFFSPLNGYEFGYRNNERSFVYNAGNNTTSLYDLSVDPYETNDLSAQEPQAVTLFHLRLAGWVQRQKAYMDARIARPAFLAAAR